MPPEGQGGGVHSFIDSWICGLWVGAFDANLSSEDGAHTAVMLPLPAYKAPFSASTVESYFILKNTAHPNEAWQWISFLTQNQAASGDMIPPLRSLAASEAYKGRVPDSAFQIANNLPKDMIVLSYAIQNDPRYSETFSLFREAATQIVYGQVDPLQALSEAQVKAEEEFSKPTEIVPTATP